MFRRLLLVLAVALPLPTLAAAQFTPGEYQARRAALLALLPTGDMAIVGFGARAPAADYLRFYQDPDFNYLTGIQEPNAGMIIIRRGGATESAVFVGARETVVNAFSGAAMSADQASTVAGMPGRPAAEFRQVLDSLAAAGVPLYAIGEVRRGGAGVLGALSPAEQVLLSLRARHPNLKVTPDSAQVSQLRGRKSAAELALIRKAIDITVLAHREAMGAMAPGMNEFEIQALVEYTFRRFGAAGPSFATIIGSGPNSTVLHYNADDRVMRAGEMVVMDIGASYKGYAADVTRTVPVNGVFTKEQRDIYQIVRDAQKAAENAAKIGVRASALGAAADSALTAGLRRIGLVDSVGTYECGPAEQPRRCPQLRLFYYHGLGHGIGLEAHDPDQYTRGIQPGSAFTIEPGVYVREHVLDLIPDRPANRALRERLRPLVARYRNIGVRIEDDYLVTEKGVEWVSRAPREITEIEALMRRPWTPMKRDPALVRAYGDPPPPPPVQ